MTELTDAGLTEEQIFNLTPEEQKLILDKARIDARKEFFRRGFKKSETEDEKKALQALEKDYIKSVYSAKIAENERKLAGKPTQDIYSRLAGAEAERKKNLGNKYVAGLGASDTALGLKASLLSTGGGLAAGAKAMIIAIGLGVLMVFFILPAIIGMLLSGFISLDPIVFILGGFLSSLAFVPAILLPKIAQQEAKK